VFQAYGNIYHWAPPLEDTGTRSAVHNSPERVLGVPFAFRLKRRFFHQAKVVFTIFLVPLKLCQKSGFFFYLWGGCFTTAFFLPLFSSAHRFRFFSCPIFPPSLVNLLFGPKPFPSLSVPFLTFHTPTHQLIESPVGLNCF